MCIKNFSFSCFRRFEVLRSTAEEITAETRNPVWPIECDIRVPEKITKLSVLSVLFFYKGECVCLNRLGPCRLKSQGMHIFGILGTGQPGGPKTRNTIPKFVFVATEKIVL